MIARTYGSGWAFLLPYVAVWAACLATGASFGLLRSLFVVLHVANLLVFSLFAAQVLHSRYSSFADLARDVGFWFWMLFAVVVLVPGAYMEFPGDPWEHLRRINGFHHDQAVGFSYVTRFGYVWGWTLLSWFEPGTQRVVSSWYSAFWQLLLGLAFARFAARLGLSPGWARVAVFGSLALFGNNVFSFFRYYALAPTMIAYIAYLRAASAILDLTSGGRGFPVLLLTVVLIAVNHPQELLLLTVFTLSAFLVKWGPAWLPPRRWAPMAAVVATWAAGLAVGKRLINLGESLPTMPIGSWLSAWGVFRVWDPSLSYAQTLGALGVLAILVAPMAFRYAPLLATLALVPILLLMYPPFALLATAWIGPFNSYRILYTLPAPFLLSSVARQVMAQRARRLGARTEGPAQAVVLVLFGACGVWSEAPLYGKLRFQLDAVQAGATFPELDETARWFLRNRPSIRERDCVIKSDTVSECVLASLLGKNLTTEKVSAQHWFVIDQVRHEWQSPGVRLDAYQRMSLCGILLPDEDAADRLSARPSWVALASGHWPTDAGRLGAHLPAALREEARLLGKRGWRQFSVPPFYVYYERPTHPMGLEPAPSHRNLTRQQVLGIALLALLFIAGVLHAPSLAFRLVGTPVVRDATPVRPSRTQRLEARSLTGFLPSLAAVALSLAMVGVSLFWTADAGYQAALGALASSLLVVAISATIERKSMIVRLMALLAAAVVAAACGVVLEELSLPLVGRFGLGPFAYPITLLWILGLGKAFELMSDLAGLAGGTAVIASAFFFFAAWNGGGPFILVLSYALLACTLVFLCLDLSPTRSLAHVGAVTVGILFATLAVIAARYDRARTSFMVIPLLLFTPIFDATVTLARRHHRRRPVRQEQGESLYQLCLRLGYPGWSVALAYYLAAVAQGFLALWMVQIGGSRRAAVFFPVVLVHTACAVWLLGRARRAGILDLSQSARLAP